LYYVVQFSQIASWFHHEAGPQPGFKVSRAKQILGRWDFWFYYIFETDFSRHNTSWGVLPRMSPRGYGPAKEVVFGHFLALEFFVYTGLPE